MSFLPLDTPNEEIKPPKKFRNLKIQLFASALILALLTWTVAANVNVSTGGRIEFGQGATEVLTCDSHVIISPDSQIDTQTGTSYLRNLKISDISSQLRNSTVTIDIVDSNSQSILQAPMKFTLSSDAKTINSTTFSTSSSIDRSTPGGGPKQEVGKSSITFSNILSKTGGKVDTTNANVFVLQTSGYTDCTPPSFSCADGGTCALGNTGPGGGIVFYVASTPFLIQGTSTYANYLEAAPSGWLASNPGSPTSAGIDPNYQVCSSSSGSPLGYGYGAAYKLSDAIGAGASNTDKIYSYQYCHDAGLAVTVIKNYRGGGFSDWFLPSIDEMRAIRSFKNANGLAGFSTGYYWTSSTYDSTQDANSRFGLGSLYLERAVGAAQLAQVNGYNPIRAVRAF